jgi:hypothetical protein
MEYTGSSPVPGTNYAVICPSSAIGRGNGLRSRTVWVRIPPWAPNTEQLAESA